MNVKLSNLHVLAQAESICVQAGRLERVKVLKLPWALGMRWWGLCTDGVDEGCAGKIQIVGLWRDVDGSRYRRFLGSTIQLRRRARMRAKQSQKTDANGRKSTSRALIHAY